LGDVVREIARRIELGEPEAIAMAPEMLRRLLELHEKGYAVIEKLSRARGVLG
jgi:hypothetical protein